MAISDYQTLAVRTQNQAVHRRLRHLHGLLAVQSLVVVLVSINRLSTLTLGYVAPNEFMMGGPEQPARRAANQRGSRLPVEEAP